MLKEEIKTSENEKIKDFIDGIVGELHADKLMFETNTAPKDTHDMYSLLSKGDATHLAAEVRGSTSLFFVKKIIFEFLGELKERNTSPSQLGLTYSDSTLLVWALADSDDMESQLILAEAKINANFNKYGFHISTTIVEPEDELPIPSHYIKING